MMMAVDKGIKQRSHDMIEDSYHFTEVHSTTARGREVHEDAAAVCDGDDNEVGDACGESFLPSRGRRDAQHRREDLDVGGDVNGKSTQDTTCGQKEIKEL
ncbi:hypothetical protein Y1Q_0019925 [Alligator mississippiensis]|uniref:Uncharacterized protein n=1 Tax=Alligator mississippiensis TaxID=8496 RepID=A0A151MUN1_ALLMI|nr:hypothetical protein Y1Q_0019925 [Alligator mississippiensis]